MFSLLVLILPVSCVVIPLSQVEDSATKLLLDVAPVELDVALAVHEPLNTTSLAIIGPRDARTNPPCPPGQVFDRSICYTSGIISRYCNTVPQSPNGDRKEVFCANNEVCVQRLLSNGKPFADCQLISSLIQWRTDPIGSKEGCTTASSKRGKTHAMGTIVYDINEHPIQVGKIKYFGEPGDVPKGTSGTTNNFASESWDFDNGNLNAFSWLI
uniref:EC36-2 protein n=1 Tax=Colletotrichum higginsianum TaxID=80884 RepID=I2G7B4_9PEZI|nr:EC36-2 protein [Colletotrichum higginsianum]